MCFSDRKKPVCCIMIMSALAAICGIVMIAFAFVFTNQDVLKQMEKENADIEDGRKMVFAGLVAFSLLTIAAAIMGFCTKCCKSWCFNICFGTILLPIWIVVVVIGAGALFISVAAEDKITEECNKLLNEVSQVVNEKFGDQINADLNNALADAEKQAEAASGGGFSFKDAIFNGGASQATNKVECPSYVNLDAITINLDIYSQIGINEFMCSSDCPCKDVSKKTDWTNLTNEQIENRDMPCKAFDFSGKKGDKEVNFTTYKECI
jgi:hypothetical protein